MDESGSSNIILTPGTFDEFNSQLQTNALTTTRNALALPTDVMFHRSVDPIFSKELDGFSSKVLSLTNKLLSLISTEDAAQSSRIKGKGKLQNQDDVVDGFHSLVVDSMDKLLERTDICLDEYLGLTKPPAIAINPIVQKAGKRGKMDPVIQHASHLPKPQLSFKRRVENTDSPWYPKLSHKYNAQVPLGYNFYGADVDTASPGLISTHPYRYEITHMSYPERMFISTTPCPSKDFTDTPFTWVSTTHDLQAMLAKLRQASEIAVDLEHHDYRSYAGFLCLMQISTRQEDWIIDTLALREELTELNEVFTNPNIVKVFHGADSDIIWLQQDFDIYVVNLFDTYHASKALEFPRHGLANLLEMYCDFTPDKRYQLADWRIRPLPKEMLDYARSDTHFLLYIYDNLRNALIDRSQSRAQSISPIGSPSDTPNKHSRTLMKQVLTRSEETSLKTFEKETYDAQGGSGNNGWDALARKWNKGALLAGGPDVGTSALQRAVYRSVHMWRDMVAREDDESTRYVLPNHFLFQIAEHPPADMAALLRIFPSVPPIIRRRAKELLEVIKDSTKLHLSNASGPPIPAHKTEVLVPPNTVEKSFMISEENTPSSLWSQGHDAVSSSSSLFGFTPSATRKPAGTFTASKSSLLGSMAQSKLHNKPGLSFQALVARINSTLVIMPSAPKVVEEKNVAIQEDVTLHNSPQEAPGMQVEIPYIPATQRTTTQVIDDSIIIVGQARQRKRKRTKASPDNIDTSLSAEGSSTGKTHGNTGSKDDLPSSEREPFEFSAVPNILDDNPDLKTTKKRQKKQKKDFPAPPKAHSEVKRGNQSHTFK